MEEILKLVQELGRLAFTARVYLDMRFEKEGGQAWLESKGVSATLTTQPLAAAVKLGRPKKAPAPEKNEGKSLLDALGGAKKPGPEVEADVLPEIGPGDEKQTLEDAYKLATAYITAGDRTARVAEVRAYNKARWGVPQVSDMKHGQRLEFIEYVKGKIVAESAVGVGV